MDSYTYKPLLVSMCIMEDSLICAKLKNEGSISFHQNFIRSWKRKNCLLTVVNEKIVYSRFEMQKNVYTEIEMQKLFTHELKCRKCLLTVRSAKNCLLTV